jgi:adenylate cyclase
MAEERARRKLSGILSADAVGYSRLMEEDEASTILTLADSKELMANLIQQYRGRVVDAPGDNLLAEFSSVVDATECAVKIQEELKSKNAELPDNRKMQFRIGVNLGDVVEKADRIYGDGVNIAARLEGLAKPGGICISRTTYDHVKNKLEFGYQYLGEHSAKNIAEPVRVYRVLVEPEAAGKVIGEKKFLGRVSRRFAIAVIIGLVIVAGGLIGWNIYLHQSKKIEPASLDKMEYPLPDKPSIAVLAFDNLTGDPKQEFFCDGISEEIITGLSKVPELFVIARNSSFTYKGKPVKIQQVAEDLGVRYVLEGSVRKSQENLRVTAQLIDAIKGYHLWAESWDRELKDVFAIQDDITMKIATALQVELTKGERARIIAKGTNNLDAYLKALEANENVILFNPENNELARQLAKEAIDTDPLYAFAYAILGKTHLLDVWLGTSPSPKKSIFQAMELVQKAIDIDESLGIAYGLLGFLYTMTGQHEKGIIEAEKAIALEPNSDLAHQALGLALRFGDRPNDAIPVIKKAIRLNPFAPSTYLFNLGLSYLFSGQYEEAVAQCKKATIREPNNLGAQLSLTVAYGLSGRDEEARATAQEVLRINPKFSLERLSKSLVYKNRADKDRFIDALRKAGLPDKPSLPLPSKPSIAVLPFVNMSGDTEQEYFSDGITEEIITALSKTPKLFVIARTSSFKYKGKQADVRTVGRELGVHYVLEGSVRKGENRVRITAQLIDAIKGHHLWAERYDRDLKDIFSLQDEITMRILTALQVKLTSGEEALVYGKGTSNLKAYLMFLEGREYLLLFNVEGNTLARKKLEEVIALDPNYASAYRFLSATHMMDVWLKSSKSPKQSMIKAVELTQKAITLDDSEAGAHGFLGFLLTMLRQYEKGIAEAEHAIALNPNSADAHAYLGMALRFAGKPEEAIAVYNKAIRLNPFPPSNWLYGLGLAHLFAGHCEEAIVQCKKAVLVEPNSLLNQISLTGTYGMCGREAEARVQASEVLRISPNWSLEYFAKQLTLKNQADKQRFIDALRKAGLK